MSVLRRRMVVAMRVRHFSERTEESYLHAIEQLYAFHHRMPDRLSRDDVVAFLEHCVSVRKLQRSTVNVYFQACRFLYEKVLTVPDNCNAKPTTQHQCRSEVVCAKPWKHDRQNRNIRLQTRRLPIRRAIPRRINSILP